MAEAVHIKMRVITAAAVIGVASIFFARWVTLAVAILLFASIKIFDLGVLTRTAVSIFLTGVAGAVLMQITSLLHINFNFTVFYVVWLLAALTYAYVYWDDLDLRSSAADILGFVVGATVFLVVAVPLLGASTSKTLEYLITGEDNNSHFQMYRYVLAEKHYAYDNSMANAGIRPSLLSYAQGSHATMATLTAPFAEHASRGAQLKAYVMSAAAIFSVMFWLGFVLISRPLRAVRNTEWRLSAEALLATAYLILVPFGILLSLYTYGYYAHYFSYVGLALVMLYAVSLKDGMPLSRKRLLAEVVLLLLGFYAVVSSWYLIAPIALVPILAYAWGRRVEILRHKYAVLVPVAIAAILIAYLGYIFLFTSLDGAGHLLTTGGVEKMRYWVLVVALPAVFLAWLNIKRQQWISASFAVALLLAAFLAGAIGLDQIAKIGHFDYYFYKSLFTVVFMAVLYYGYNLVSSFSAVLNSLRPATKAVPNTGMIFLAAAGVVLVGVSLTLSSKPVYLERFTEVKYALPQQAPNRLLDIFTQDQLYNKYSDVIDLSNCNPYSNFTGTIWAGGFFLPYDKQRGELENELQTDKVSMTEKNRTEFSKSLEVYAASKRLPVAVVTSNLTCAGWRTIASGLQDAPNMKVISIDKLSQ